MFWKSKKPNVADIYRTEQREDHWQIGASAAICHEIASIRLRYDIETLQHNQHLARDIGLLK